MSLNFAGAQISEYLSTGPWWIRRQNWE